MVADEKESASSARTGGRVEVFTSSKIWTQRAPELFRLVIETDGFCLLAEGSLNAGHNDCWVGVGEAVGVDVRVGVRLGVEVIVGVRLGRMLGVRVGVFDGAGGGVFVGVAVLLVRGVDVAAGVADGLGGAMVGPG